MSDLPAQLDYIIKQLNDKKTPIGLRVNYYNQLIKIRDHLTNTISSFMFEYEGKNNKKDKD